MGDACVQQSTGEGIAALTGFVNVASHFVPTG